MNILDAVHVRYTHPIKDLGNSETIVFHSGTNILSSPLVLDRQLDTVIDTLRERHITFNHNLSGLVLDEIIKTDLQLAEYIPLAGLKLRQLLTFLAKKEAIIKVKKTQLMRRICCAVCYSRSRQKSPPAIRIRALIRKRWSRPNRIPWQTQPDAPHRRQTQTMHQSLLLLGQ